MPFEDLPRTQRRVVGAVEVFDEAEALLLPTSAPGD